MLFGCLNIACRSTVLYLPTYSLLPICHHSNHHKLHQLYQDYYKLLLAYAYPRPPLARSLARPPPAPNTPYFTSTPTQPFLLPTPAIRLFYRGTAVSHSMCVPGNCLI